MLPSRRPDELECRWLTSETRLPRPVVSLMKTSGRWVTGGANLMQVMNYEHIQTVRSGSIEWSTLSHTGSWRIYPERWPRCNHYRDMIVCGLQLRASSDMPEQYCATNWYRYVVIKPSLVVEVTQLSTQEQIGEHGICVQMYVPVSQRSVMSLVRHRS